MLKLYQRIEGALHYHEAWVSDDKTVVEHWGKVGERGAILEHKRLLGQSEDENLERVLSEPLAKGFRPIGMDDHVVLRVEYAIEGHGNVTDLKKRHALEERMNETLGWTGLGHCDGGSIGSGTMEVCCYVVDFDLARRVIQHDLEGTEFADFSRLARE